MVLHIVFDKEGADAVSGSFELDENLKGEIVFLNEDWSVGPLLGTINSDGETTSRAEWNARLFKTQLEPEASLEKIKKYLAEHAGDDAWIWIAPNAKDVCGYYYLISNLDEFKGRIYTLWLNNLPFINDKGLIFYPLAIAEIPAREFVKASKLAQEVSPAVFETDPDEWKKMQRENKLLRILEGAKKITGKEESFFDKDLAGFLTNDWQKNNKLLQQLATKTKELINKSFLLWRLREMIQKDIIEARGDWPASDTFDVRKKQTVQQLTEHE